MYLKCAQTDRQTDRHTDRHTDSHTENGRFFFLKFEYLTFLFLSCREIVRKLLSFCACTHFRSNKKLKKN